ncbi:MAG: glycine hydroxymethyltransferase [Deltaproteobacteria bacterium]|nr:glycine hydroxymethyltransferase [Deltaproteobacteria bacterium]
MNSAVISYLESLAGNKPNISLLAYLAVLEQVAKVSPLTASDIVQELADQRSNLKLIASENYSSLSVQAAMGNLLTDKYAEGFPYHRFYAGCDNVDHIEARACEEACKLFGSAHAYVQPHSGADANLVAYWAILQEKIGTPKMEALGLKKFTDLNDQQWNELRQLLGNQRMLGLDYYSGGHLTHGYRYNVSAQMFEAHTYTVDKATGLLDYNQIEDQAKKVKPLILLAGYSAYPRKINFKIMREIADRVGAVLMVDMAHFAGLVAGKVFAGDFDPIAHAQVVTSTTHKTLRGPRGGLVLCSAEFSEQVNKGCPLVLGGPLPHVIAAKEICFREANTDAFRDYAQRIVANCQALSEACIGEGMKVLTGGTDNHLMLIDVSGFGVNGRQAEAAVRECGVTLNRNAIPFDVNGPWFTSGLRLGTAAVTTLGMGLAQMKEIAAIIKAVLSKVQPAQEGNGQASKSKYILSAEDKKNAVDRVQSLLINFPVYPELDLGLLQNYFQVN